LVDELVIIDGQLLPIARDGTLHVPGCDYLLMRCRCRGIRRLGRRCRGGPPAGAESDRETRGVERLTNPSATAAASFSARLSGPVVSSSAIPENMMPRRCANGRYNSN
jgi:hypothetical protein